MVTLSEATETVGFAARAERGAKKRLTRVEAIREEFSKARCWALSKQWATR